MKQILRTNTRLVRMSRCWTRDQCISGHSAIGWAVFNTHISWSKMMFKSWAWSFETREYWLRKLMGEFKE
jgi:hypothetical protein